MSGSGPPSPGGVGRVYGIIPARWAATRFPGKPLADVAGKSLLRRVWERAAAARRLDGVIVATDDGRIAAAAAAFGARVAWTRASHQSGTDRVAEAAAGLGPEVTHVINVQGDEPLIEPDLIDALVGLFHDEPGLPMVTAACPLTDPRELASPHCVKVVCDRRGDALYFSRAPIPHGAAGGAAPPGPGRRPAPDPAAPAAAYRHQGIYGYARPFLAAFVGWPPSSLERAERLEQLRALENGGRIRVLLTTAGSPGVDTPEDVGRVVALLRRREEQAAAAAAAAGAAAAGAAPTPAEPDPG